MKKPISNRPSYKKIDLDASIELSSEEKAEIEEAVRAQLKEDRKKQLKQEYFRTLMRRLSGEVDIQWEKDSEEFQSYTIDLAPHADRIILDGTHYMHGQTYIFNLHQLRTVKDIVAQTWRHERTIGHANRDFYVPVNAINRVITPSNPNGLIT